MELTIPWQPYFADEIKGFVRNAYMRASHFCEEEWLCMYVCCELATCTGNLLGRWDLHQRNI